MHGNININKARVIGEDFVLKQENDYDITDYSIGYGRVGTVGKVVKLRKQSFRYALSPTLAVINPSKKIYASYVYYGVKSPIFSAWVEKNTSGTTRPAIGIQALRKIPLLNPGALHNDLISDFEGFAQTAMSKTDILNKESQQLRKLRNWLLPMLMNGQVRVGE